MESGCVHPAPLILHVVCHKCFIEQYTSTEKYIKFVPWKFSESAL